MSTRWIERIFAVFFLISIFTGISRPCGPGLPNRVLEERDDYVLKPPEGYFAVEIERIRQTLDGTQLPGGLLGYESKNNIETSDADLSDLKKAMGNADADNLNLQTAIEEYKKARRVISNFKKAERQWQREKNVWGHRFDANQSPAPEFIPPDIPAGLPVEFDDYFRGAVLYHQGRFDAAKSVWERLLQRPENKRKYRSTWAAYMIGRVLVDSEPEDAAEWFGLVRRLAGEGFADSQGLAAASIGWEARAEFNRGNYSQAIALYMAQFATGDRTALPSLQIVCADVLRSDIGVQKEIAANPLARKVVTAYILSHGGPFHRPPSPELINKWLKAIEGANINTIDEAGRFAWMSYSMGQTGLARRWVSKAPQNDIMAQWIGAKLLLQEGKVSDATKQLVRVARIVAPNGQMNEYQKYDYFDNSVVPAAKVIRGELGSLYLSQRQYIESLDTLMRGGHWEDAAYIAERILTVEELQTYIDKTWPDGGEDNLSQEMSVATMLRFLFARRLARLGRFEDARPYYPVKWQKRLDVYTRALWDGDRRRLSGPERASALWKAAVIARYEGMELMGTELEPDWSVYSGKYNRKPMTDIRGNRQFVKITSSSSDEIQRTQQTIPPEERFHYRYIAAQLAWRAAELMPDNSDQTARVLCIAGSWLKARDPGEADKFYKSLVIRCRKTNLGREADKIRWFPNMEYSGAFLLKEVE
ncbi:MAG: hypothetical protein JW715_08585 [Sedimentisphaerales bacterium]|nr:hypothetical protein [Sedimentisphaerales bacterium]